MNEQIRVCQSYRIASPEYISWCSVHLRVAIAHALTFVPSLNLTLTLTLGVASLDLCRRLTLFQSTVVVVVSIVVNIIIIIDVVVADAVAMVAT